MRSKASIKGHPIHPILITFPIAFFIGTFTFDLIALLGNQDFHNVAKVLSICGIVTALLAAVPGIVDFIFTVPPDSSAKKRAGKHGLLNVTVVVLFSIALWFRMQQDPSSSIIIVLEGLGVVLLGIAGWMGGTLVYRNQIGVDPRYAESGKWKEEYFEKSDNPIKIASSDERRTNQMKLVHIDGKRIVLSRTEKGYSAFDDRCPHKGGSLAGGSMMCGTVQCPWHGSQFDVTTGKVTAGPAEESIKTYSLSETNGNVFIDLKK